jgi:hypothetical protein
MTEKLETIKLIDTAQEAKKKMIKKNVSSLTVVHEDCRLPAIGLKEILLYESILLKVSTTTINAFLAG